MPDGSFLPTLSTTTHTFIRVAYGVLMLATLAQALPEARRFFLSERWGGYTRSTRWTDAVQSPIGAGLLLAAWIAAAAALAAGWATPWAALVNLILCRYFFIHLRWKSVLRGMGAPGFIAYWTGLAVFLLELTQHHAPGLQSLALFVAQIDFALVMLSAGVYKATAGYLRNHGMELGLCNPMWGYWWRTYAAKPPNSPVFWTMNQLAWGTEVALAVLAFVPATRELAGLLLIGSFLFILTQIRLGFLCEMVMVCGLLYVPAGGAVDAWIARIVVDSGAVSAGAAAPMAGAVLEPVLWTYLALLPFAHAGLYYNFYARRRLAGPLQRLLERYTNLFGMIIWRVFSVDVVNFFIRIWREPRDGGPRELAGRPGSWPRFNHVGEMICITSLFTTLKYYPSNDALFQERVLRYARTLPREAGDRFVFEYVSVVKRESHFDWVPVAEYQVDVESGTVTERVLDASFSPRAPHAASPVHEGAVPGSYAPPYKYVVSAFPSAYAPGAGRRTPRVRLKPDTTY
jgi:hypothetical protein